MNSVQSSIFLQSRFSLFLCRRTSVLGCKSRGLSCACTGRLLQWFYPIFCRLRRLYHRIFVRQQSGCTRKIFAKQEGMERSESSNYLLTIPYPVCILRIVNNVHVEVIG